MFPLCSELLEFGRDNNLAVGPLRVVIVIVLMVAFGDSEFLERPKLSHDRIRSYLLVAEFLNYFFSCLFLRFVMVKDNRCIFCTDIMSLTIEGSRIMKSEKNFQKLCVWNKLWIIYNLYDFYMSGCSRTDLFVGWVRSFAAAVSWLYFYDSIELIVSAF